MSVHTGEKHQVTTVEKKRESLQKKRNKTVYANNITDQALPHRSPHTFKGCLTFHRGTTNPTRSIGLQDTSQDLCMCVYLFTGILELDDSDDTVEPTRESPDLQRGGYLTLAQLWALPGVLGHLGTTGSQLDAR